jgi:hypothetical protein
LEIRVSEPSLPPAISNAGAAYAGRRETLRAVQQRLGRRIDRLARWRRVVIAALVLIIVLVEREGTLAKLVLVGAPALVLDYLIKRRVRVSQALSTARWLAAHYDRRIACLEEHWVGTGEPGTRYLDPDHPAAPDLDLFGRGGLFERVVMPSTRAGDDTLASWLLTPAGAVEVRERQAAVVELRDRFELREELAYLAGQVAASEEFQHVTAWGLGKLVFRSPAVRILGTLTLSLTAVAMLGALFMGTGAAPVLVALGLQAAFAVALRRRAGAVLGPMEERGYDLASLGRLLARVERETFTSPRLRRLQQELASGPASRRVAWLHRLHRYAPFALLLACRPQMAILLDRWCEGSGPAFGRWLAVLGEVEALCALAAYSFECPDDPFPEVIDRGAIFEAEGLGHPLLPRERCVRNDLSLGDGLRVLIVSGSNMAGKSTLLRTAGINAVLALAGAPVRAGRLRLAPLAVGGTLRIQDSLLAGRSRFQAEVLRVRQLLEMAHGEPPLLFLLDELFQGTNSADRRVGAEAVLRQLVDAGAIGLVTTHDLALTEIADQLGGLAANVHCEDRLDDGEITFDYRMRPGVLRHGNGVALMRAVGIDV